MTQPMIGTLRNLAQPARDLSLEEAARAVGGDGPTPSPEEEAADALSGKSVAVHSAFSAAAIGAVIGGAVGAAKAPPQLPPPSSPGPGSGTGSGSGTGPGA